MGHVKNTNVPFLLFPELVPDPQLFGIGPQFWFLVTGPPIFKPSDLDRWTAPEILKHWRTSLILLQAYDILYQAWK
jgi:hypothetical protein